MIAKKAYLLMFAVILCFSFLPVLPARAQVQDAISGERIAGVDRYSTSIEISKFGWSSTADTAVIATGMDFPDALCAAPLAEKFNAPILLTDPGSLSKGLNDELDRLKVKNVFIIGGTGVISRNIENQLTAKNIKVTRLSGVDRYETSAAVAAQLGSNGKAVIATGENFPDALSIAPWAASNRIPILLTEPTRIPKAIANYIKNSNINSTYVIGGTGVVSDDVMAGLKGAQRIQGQDRYSTNLEVLKTFNSQYDYNKIYLATGEDFPDALSGSVLAALTKSPVILAPPKPLPPTKDYIDSNRSKLNEAYILGGEGAVSNNSIEGVIPPVVTKIEIVVPPAGVGMGKKSKITANVTMLPSNAPKPDIVYTTGNTDIIKVEPDGTVTGIVAGTAKITASAAGISSSAAIQVKLDKLIVLDPGHGGWSSGAVPTAQDGTKLVQYKESILNLQIVEKIRKKLAAIGANVVLTREGDTYASLDDRAKLANDLKADLFLSIHHDSAATPLATGTSAFYSSYKPGVDTNGVYVVADGTGPVYDDKGNKIGNLENNKEYPYVKGDGEDIYILYNGSTAKTTTQYVLVYDRTPSSVSLDSAKLASSINSGIVSLGLPPHGVRDNNLAVNMMTNCASVLVEVGFISNLNELEKVRQDSFQTNLADKVVQAIVSFYKDKNSAVQSSGTIPATP